jgi:hypothetical protein
VLGWCEIFRRLIRSGSTQHAGKDSRGGTVGGEADALQRWLADVYLPSLTEQITNSLDYLHNAINWGLVVLSGTLVVVLTNVPYRDTTTLPALLVILVLCVHFFCRTARAYINVIRFSLVHRAITNRVLSINALSSEIDPVEAIRTYIVQWKLPLRRVDVFRKVLFELGYGYPIVIDITLIVYVIVTAGPRLAAWFLVGIAVVLISVELTVFVKSPYMRNPVPNEDAVRDR